MAHEDKLLKRLHESAEDFGRQLAAKSNFPIQEFLNVVELVGLRDTFGIDPEAMTSEDLTRILMARDALFAVVEQTNDLDEEGKHSIEQMMNSLNRMYVNCQAYLNTRTELRDIAEKALEAQQNTRLIPISPDGPIGQTVINVSTEVINNVSVTNNQINIHILNGLKVDMLRNLRVQIRRLSASAFVVNVKINAKVMFEGTIQFLTATADRVLADLREMASALKESFGSAEAIVKSLDNVIKSGTKFVRVVGSLIQDALEDAGEASEVKLTLRNATNSRAITCSALLSDGRAALCGRNGVVYFVSQSGQVTSDAVDNTGVINCVTELGDGRLALGTSDGMTAWTPRFRGGGTEQSRHREKIVALAAQEFQSSETAIAANSFGELNRWWFPGGRPDLYGQTDQLRKPPPQTWGPKNRDGRVKSMLVLGERTVVARNNAVSVVDSELQAERDVPFNQTINAMCRLNDTEVVLVGDALVAVVDTTHGLPVRMLPVPADAAYVSVVVLNENLIAVCDGKGRVVAIDLRSGAEMGEVATHLETRGLVVVGKFIVAYGGAWNNQSRSIAFILWEEKIAARLA